MLTLRTYPDPVLSAPCEPVPAVDDAVRALSADMIDTMIKHNGVGLAAPQVGLSIRMFVVDIWWPRTGSRARALTFINPKIEVVGKDTQRGQEGCLSLPELSEFVTRASKIRVEALGLDGQPFTLDADGFLAVAIQHENDHLDGKTMLDRLGPTARRMAKKKLRFT